MENLTLESLPQAFVKLSNDVSEIKKLLLDKSDDSKQEPDRWFNLSELCAYHPDKPTKATVYGWVNAGSIPAHKSGKKLRFLKSEIDTWLKQGRIKTFAETATEAENYLKNKGSNNG